MRWADPRGGCQPPPLVSPVSVNKISASGDLSKPRPVRCVGYPMAHLTHTITAMKNPWAEIPGRAPYVLPQDVEYLNAWNELHRHRPRFQVRLDYPPEPFLGRRDAPLVLLQANPALGPADGKMWASSKVVAYALESVSSPKGAPFFWLRDELAWTAGANWWRPRTAALRTLRKDLANHMLSVEFHGYHSRSWQALPVTLPSQLYSFHLVREAMRRDAVVVVVRAWREWQVAVPGLAQYERLVRTRSAQTSHVTPRNVESPDKWKIIRQALSDRP